MKEHTDESLLEINNLRCSVRPGHALLLRKQKLVLYDVSFGLAPGRTIGLLGSSGSGKSTLARCIAGLQIPDAGEIVYKGMNIFPQSENRRPTHLDIQMLFQASSASLDPTMTVAECINEGIEAGKSKRERHLTSTARELIEAVGMATEVLQRFPSQLSGGQRQRIAIARTLAAQPTLLILDEPTSALDAITQQRILSLLQKLQREHHFTILFITHDVRTALTFCDRIMILHEGRIVEDSSSEALRGSQREAYTRQLFADARINS